MRSPPNAEPRPVVCADRRGQKPSPQPSRRRTAILAAIGLLLFLLGFGLGLSLGIMITIKKGDKTTTIEAPDGSNVKINDKGEITVDATRPDAEQSRHDNVNLNLNHSDKISLSEAVRVFNARATNDSIGN